MSYAIFTVFYGLPLTSRTGRSTGQHKFVDREPDGLHTMYSGSATDTPAAFGVKIGGFTECCHHVELASLPLVATQAQKNEYQALFEALSPRDKDVLKDLGDARVFFLVGSS